MSVVARIEGVPRQQTLHKTVLVPDHGGVGGPLGPDGVAGLGGGGGRTGAEAPESVGGVEREALGQGPQPERRAVLGAGQLFGEARRDQVSAPHRSIEQRASTEEGSRTVLGPEQEREAGGGVAGGGQGLP